MLNSLNRRTLLAGSLAGSLALGTPHITLAKGSGSRNLLFVLLRGAADGMAMLAPVGDPDFARLRERTMPDYEGAQTGDGFFAIHKVLENIGAAYAQGDALFVHAAATSYRKRSHFDGQNMLETGAAAPYAKSDGWLNRLVGLMADEAGSAPKALAISPSMPLVLRGPAPASNYAPSGSRGATEDFRARVGQLYQNDPQLGLLWQQALETRAMAADNGIRNLRDAQRAGELAASLMREEAGARIAAIEIGGWDSHANQRGAFNRQATQLDTLLGAYRISMGSRWADTMVIVATEFGRTARFNGTNGTDHGTAGAAIVMGGRIKGGRVIADWPGLADADLYEGRDLRPTIALQSVFAGAASEHLGLDRKSTMTRLFPDHSDAPLTGIAAG